MNAAVIGGGISGLVTAYRLAEQGAQVTVFEASGVVGGLASTFTYRDARLERYYHFVCRPDVPYFRLLDELGLSDKLVWKPSRMGYFYNGRRFDFGTPESLIGFSPLSWASRFRFGMATLKDRAASDWHALDAMTARDWLIAEYGEQTYEVVWRPLLETKFGEAAPDVSAAWMWARINRVARSHEGLLMREHLGYLEGGTQTLIDELVRRIEARGGRIRTSTPVDRIAIEGEAVSGVRATGSAQDEPFDVVVSTVAPPLLIDIAPDLPRQFADTLRRIGYHGVVCWMILAEQPLSRDFWLNISDPYIRVSGVITYTNLNPMPELGGLHLLYIPLYMSTADPRWAPSDDELPDMLAALERIRPGFSERVVEAWAFRDPYAQPLFTAGYHARFSEIEEPVTPVRGLFRADMSQIYPDDRSVVNAIDKADGVARAVAAAGFGVS